MIPRLPAAITFLLLLAAPGCASHRTQPPPPAPAPDAGPPETRPPDLDDAALLDRALDLFVQEDPSFDPERTRERIHALSGKAARWLRDLDRPDEIVETLNWFFFNDQGFASDLDLEDPDNLYPDRVLKRHRGYCTGLALIYLAVADQLDLPVYGVNSPEHLFLRYDDGREAINIELLAAGREVPDEHYRERDRIDPASEAGGVFLVKLDDDRFLSQVANNLGTINTRDGRASRAERLYRRAIELDPRNPTAHYNLARQRMAQGRCAEALPDFTHALELHPNDVQSLNNRGVCRARLGDPDGAATDFLAALAIDPGSESARRNLEKLAGSKSPRR